MSTLNKQEIQGIILRGYSNLPSANYMLLQVDDRSKAKQWIAEKQKNITDGVHKPKNTAMNIAFTLAGLKALGLKESAINSFSNEFVEGMATEHKQMMFGDYGTSDPKNWTWGGVQSPEIHILLMLYATDAEILSTLYDEVNASLMHGGISLIKTIDTERPAHQREHFGFKDGISQPVIAELSKKSTPENTIAAGEFILGYKNEYDAYTDGPSVKASEDPDNLLPLFPESQDKDFGANGSYLVFRQLAQDVKGFWEFMYEKTKDADGKYSHHEAVKLASKMVGRWPDGASLVECPEKQDSHQSEKNNFTYYKQDPLGHGCPFGAHTKRSHPRDSLENIPEESVSVSRKHRLLRRGRSFGEPVAPSMNPSDIHKTDDTSASPRGLNFICFNADLARQFEFVQNIWINNPKFNGLYDEVDPLIGNPAGSGKQSNTFSIQELPFRKRIQDVPQFVHVLGGSYFFMPSISALKYLATC